MTSDDIKMEMATHDDFVKIKALLKSIDLPTAGVEAHLRNFVVLKDGDEIVGTVGLEVYDEKALLRSLAVVTEYQGRGLGERLYREAIAHARRLGILQMYILTETAETFFAKHGFQKISRASAPEDVKRSVEFQSACPQSAICMKLGV